MNDSPDNLRRIGQRQRIQAGDKILVQEIEVKCMDTSGPTREQAEAASRMLKAGKGWKYQPVPKWAIDKRVMDTAEGLHGPLDVWRPRAGK